MRIDNSEFYVLDSGEEMDIFEDLGATVKALRSTEAEDAEILKFKRDFGDGKWRIEPVSWKEIGMILMRGGGDEEAHS